MGQKATPISLRLKINRTWDSLWYSRKKQYADLILQDSKIREYLTTKLRDSGIASIKVNRSAGKTTVIIYTSKPGVIIGRQGGQIDDLKNTLSKKFGELELTIKEVKKPDINSQLIAENVARQIEKRIAYRRAAKQAISKAMQAGAKGIKIYLGGRLNGVEIARSETFKEGNIPRHTFRSIIDYATCDSNTVYGIIGIKVWVYKGDSFKKNIQK